YPTVDPSSTQAPYVASPRLRTTNGARTNPMTAEKTNAVQFAITLRTGLGTARLLRFPSCLGHQHGEHFSHVWLLTGTAPSSAPRTPPRTRPAKRTRCRAAASARGTSRV